MKIHYRRKFDAAHNLGRAELSKDENFNTYGKCLNVHGHSWIVEFTLCGKVSERNGMLVNFNILKDLIDTLDHGYVNNTIPLPTAENIVTYFIGKLQDMGLFTYINVRLYESENAYAEDEWRSQ